MPKRSLKARRITFRKKYSNETDAEVYSPCDLDGQNFLEMFCEWCADPNSISFMENEGEDFVRIKSIEKINACMLLVDTNAGKKGTSGILFDSDGIDKDIIDEDDAATGHTRALLYVPDHGESALLFSEYCQRGTAGTKLLEGFHRWFNKKFPQILLKSEAVFESEEWLKQIAAVKSIAVTVRGLPKQAYEGLQNSKGSICIQFKPARGKTFPLKILNLFRDKPLEAGKLLGVSEIDDLEEKKTKAKIVGSDGRSKVVDLNEEDLPDFLRTLNEAGEPELTNDEFVDKCGKYAVDILKRLGEI